MRTDYLYTKQLSKWILGFKKYKKVPKSLKIIAKKLFKKELEKIRKYECPFCGRKFKSKRALTTHLARSKNIGCYYAYQLMLKTITDTFEKFKENSRRKDGDYVIKVDELIRIHTKNLEEALNTFYEEVLKKNGF